jgi:hypothetical protein
MDKGKIALYLLIAFLVATILYIFAAPIFIIDSINKDSKKPKSERVYK